MTSVEEAIATLLADVPPPTMREAVPLAAAHGRVLATDIDSPLDVPPADNSSMDGYALRHAEYAAGRREFPIGLRISAGSVGRALAAGEAARIFTGAELPPGADTVVMQEECTVADSLVRFGDGVRPGDNVRPRGQDIAKGARVLTAGTRLGAVQLGLLASVGIAQAEVWRRVRVAVLSTGDELVEPGAALRPGQIYNSNRYLLCAQLEELGCEVIDGGIVPDSLEQTRQRLREAAVGADAVITTGGVSVGEEDHVKTAVEELGMLRLWKLAIKPGKPLAYGRVAGKVFFGLPGNPSSVFVTFQVIARPCLERMQGRSAAGGLRELHASADFEVARPGKRQDYLRARLVGTGSDARVVLYPNQSSGVLMSVAWANCLAVIPPDTVVARGDRVRVLLL